MCRSPKSRGKGSRRWPGRPGGARKRKRVGAWQHRAQHRVESLADLGHPVIAIDYLGNHGDKAERAIYLLDQEMARRDVRYFAKCVGYRFRTAWFKIIIPPEQWETVTAVINQLKKYR